MTAISSWRGLWLVAHAWGIILLAMAVAVWTDHWLLWPVAVAVIGGRQLGLAILMHDAAHGCLHPSRRVNNMLGKWLTGSAVGTDLAAYRTYHLRHHKYVQQAEDPDQPLSAPFPTTRASLLRKAVRDLTGQTFVKQRFYQLKLAIAGLRPAAGGNLALTRAFGRFLIVQSLIVGLSLALAGWLPALLWLAALATFFPLFLRIRNIAEHACTRTHGSDPFSHARTTRAGWLARASVAPNWVNYHVEHHLFMAVPCYRLPRIHTELGAQGHHPQMTMAASYLDVIKLASARG